MTERADEMRAELAEAILALDEARAAELAHKILDAGGDPTAAIERAIKPTADEIGAKFEREEFFLPQLMLAGQALNAAMDVFLAAAPAEAGAGKRSVVIGTVKGDVHTIGKNVVAMMLRTGGFNVHDAGIDVPSAAFVDQAVEKEADIIALSSLLTTTLAYQREVIEELESRDLRGRFKVLIGGGPASRQWAEEIGADGYGKDANEALAEARRVLGQ